MLFSQITARDADTTEAISESFDRCELLAEIAGELRAIEPDENGNFLTPAELAGQIILAVRESVGQSATVARGPEQKRAKTILRLCR